MTLQATVYECGDSDIRAEEMPPVSSSSLPSSLCVFARIMWILLSSPIRVEIEGSVYLVSRGARQAARLALNSAVVPKRFAALKT